MPGRRSFAALVVALAAFGVASDAPAEAHPPLAGELHFIGADPGGPLASVKSGVIGTPGKQACRGARKWGAPGSRWRALDPLGRVVGEARIVGADHYDVSGCDELSLRRVKGDDGAGYYVDARSPYAPPKVARWSPDAAAFAELQRIASSRQRRIQDLGPGQLRHLGAKHWSSTGAAPRRPFRAHTFFFQWGDGAARYAVVDGVSLLVLTFHAGHWTVVSEHDPPQSRGLETAYRVMGVTDMNDDGRPDLVVHEVEAEGEWWGDATFSQRADGRWVRVGPGIFGSTA